MKHYYGMKYRSVAPGAQPKGMIDWSEGTGRYYAVIVYDRELTQKELDDYELEEVDMPSSEAHIRASAKYNQNNYDRISFTFPKGFRSILREAAKEAGESANAFCVQAVYERIEKLKLNKEEQR